MGLSTPSTGGGAPKDAEYVTGSSDSKLTSETVVSPAGDILVSGDIDGTTALSPGFGTFTQVDANNPSLLTLVLKAVTDGSTNGQVDIRIDESGGTTPNIDHLHAFASKVASDNFTNIAVGSYTLPAGAQFKIVNGANPKGKNEIRAARAQILSP